MGRRGDGVEVRPGSIRLQFTFEGQTHRRTLEVNGKPMSPTQANQNYAHRLAQTIRDQIRNGTFVMAEHFPAAGDTGSGLTVATQLDTWLGTQRIEKSTRAGYESAIRFWTTAAVDKKGGTLLGSLPLRMLRTSHALTALATRPDLTGKTVNNYVSVLREAVSLAVTDKILTDNPVAAVPRAKHQKRPPDPFTREESDKIVAHCAARYAGQVQNLVEFWFWTGLRTSEIFGLQWPNIDLASGTMLIAEALVRGEHKDKTKTNVARTVRLNSRAMAALQRQRAHTQLAGQAVFMDPRYEIRWEDERAFRRSYWTPTLKALGIRYRRPYNMRHSYATAMLMAGMKPAYCAKQLGHSVEIFHRTYAVWIDGQQDDQEMACLEKSLATKKIARGSTG